MSFFASAARTGGSPWFDLYKAYEVLVSFNGGQRHGLWKNGWVDKDQDKWFHKTANYYRHSSAYPKYIRPEPPMPLEDGKTFIRKLIQGALQTKNKQV